MTGADLARPLHDLRILDASRGIAGAVGAMYFADLGADVVRVEDPDGDRWSSHPGALAWNRNKSRARLERSDPAFAAFIAAADVVIVDDAPDTLVLETIDAAATRAANPRAVHLWLPAAAPTGRWRDLPPDPLLQAAVCGACLTSTGVPSVPPSPMLAYYQGLLGATAAMAALVGRSATGHAASVAVSGLQAFATLNMLSLVRGVDLSVIVGPLPQYRIYEAGDGRWFALCALAPHFFLRALEALDRIDLVLLDGFDGDYERLSLPEVGGVFVERLTELFATDSAEHWVGLLRAADVPCSMVSTQQAWYDGEVISALDMQVTVDVDELGPVTMPGIPITFGSTPRPAIRPMADVDVRSESWSARPGSSSSPERGDARPLEGLSVVELGTFAVGTFGPLLLESLGADVLKVESPGGDPYRNMAASFMAINRGKRSVVLDLKAPSDFARFLELARGADVLFENLRPGTSTHAAVAEALNDAHDGPVHVAINGWGERGPMARMPAFDMLLGAATGTLGHTIGLTHDMGTSTLAAFGALAALHGRRESRLGRSVSLSMANHSLMCQLGELVRCDALPAAAPEGRLDERADGFWMVTPEGEVPVAPAGEFWSTEWIAANRPCSDVVHPSFGVCTTVDSFVTIDGRSTTLPPWAPALGEHTDEVRAQP